MVRPTLCVGPRTQVHLLCSSPTFECSQGMGLGLVDTQHGGHYVAAGNIGGCCCTSGPCSDVRVIANLYAQQGLCCGYDRSACLMLETACTTGQYASGVSCFGKANCSSGSLHVHECASVSQARWARSLLHWL